MKIGMHAVLFKDAITSDTENFMKFIEASGYPGFECGLRFMTPEKRDMIFETAKAHNLEVSGLHIGLPLKRWISEPEKCTEELLEAAALLETKKCRNIIMSGAGNGSDEDTVKMAQHIQNAAEILREKDVFLYTHNHSHEFEENGRVFKLLLEHAPSLGFALDLGWVAVGGCDVFEILDMAKGRTNYVHLRDLAKEPTEKVKFSRIGEGVFDIPKLLIKIQEVVGDDGWMVIEYEDDEKTPVDYIAAKKYLDTYLK